MSGHSHYATIKRGKAIKDAVKGKVFSKHSKAISMAIKAGGSANPEMNSKLRFAIEQAKADNTPKSNIDRILARAEEAGNYDEVNYEGYGPFGIAIIVQVATDNKNRTSQEIKNVFEKGGGSMGGPGSVSYNFEQKGFLIINKKQDDVEGQLLQLIDLGVEDVNESGDVIEAYTPHETLSEIRDKVIASGMTVSSFELVMKPKTLVSLETVEKAQKALKLLDTFEDHDDVQNVFSNLDIPPEIANSLDE
jgi:YebC/PmpR family DNA-binding regulatory protein